MPQVLGPVGGGPPEVTRNELKLREAVDRLRAQLDAAREVNGKFKDALERTRDNFVRAVQGLPVRDMTETLAEVDAVLAAYDKLTEETTPCPRP
jgi:hypothetical protein